MKTIYIVTRNVIDTHNDFNCIESVPVQAFEKRDDAYNWADKLECYGDEDLSYEEVMEGKTLVYDISEVGLS